MIIRALWAGEHLGYDRVWIMIRGVTFTLQKNHMKMWVIDNSTTRWHTVIWIVTACSQWGTQCGRRKSWTEATILMAAVNHEIVFFCCFAPYSSWIFRSFGDKYCLILMVIECGSGGCWFNWEEIMCSYDTRWCEFWQISATGERIQTVPSQLVFEVPRTALKRRWSDTCAKLIHVFLVSKRGFVAPEGKTASGNKTAEPVWGNTVPLQ
jgi:hypothetical protein